ncbi:G2/M phase-specific E3 ubiquitin-protein ligase-like protein [Sarcoptes scabiei]|nr:G2/M phase-specific E3 ubiquitin-protein ligase-like protein [Sarcoptes scabiei]
MIIDDEDDDEERNDFEIESETSTIIDERFDDDDSITSTSTPSSPIMEDCESSKSVAASKAIPSDVCIFCFQNDQTNYLLGELKSLDEITAHKFCLYFSPGLSQNGEPNEGLWGFLSEDIRKELRRGSFLRCTFCSRKGAVVGCSIPECSVTFHLPCGLENNAFFHYHQKDGLYPSYCSKHRPKLTIPTFRHRALCTICQEYLKNSDRTNLLYTKCCQSYYHRKCLMNVAYHQGEFNLKCPNCNNKEEFISIMKNSGIYVPYREPTWELTGESRLEEIEFRCIATECKCTQGRNFNGDDEWELFSCDRCGSTAIHVSCAGLDEQNPEWFCDSCQTI